MAHLPPIPLFFPIVLSIVRSMMGEVVARQKRTRSVSVGIRSRSPKGKSSSQLIDAKNEVLGDWRGAPVLKL